jgi:hypothetical protein
VYFFLFIYTIFAQVGYAYYPTLSMSIKAYFEQDIFYDVSIFVTLSFITFFVCFYFLHHYQVDKLAYQIVQSSSKSSALFYLVVVSHFLVVLLYFLANYDSLSYSSWSNEDFQDEGGVAYFLFGLSFKLSVALNLILYFLIRVRPKTSVVINRLAILMLLILEFGLFIVISTKIGSRTDPVALTLAVVILEIQLGRVFFKKQWKWMKLVWLLIAVSFVLIEIEVTRNPDAARSEIFAERVLLNDYYPPCHILIAAMALNYVDPWEVAVSNSANALVLLKQPYLQATITELFNPGISTRSASYAFYLFSEGYIAMGWFGFLYNGFVMFAGVSLWRRMTSSENNYYNLFMVSLISTQLANIARSQSSYFIKDLYMIFLPAMVLFFFATGLRPALRRDWYSRASIDSVAIASSNQK